jgi:phage replication O-like protein O
MDIQAEKGYTRIADAILEKVARTKLNGTQFRILMIVWRSTYGWQKKEHELSLNYLSKATGINKRQIQRELNVLIELGIIIEKKAPTFNTGRVIGFNKNYVKSVQVANKDRGSELDTSTDVELDTPTGSELDYQNKELNKQLKDIDVYNHYISLDLVKHRVFTGDMQKAMKLARQELKCDNKFLTILLDRHKEKVKCNKGDKYDTKIRGIQEFFGQKKYQSKMLICSDYDDGIYEKPKTPTNEVNLIDTSQVEVYYANEETTK